jgi:hypothetical protein
LYEHWRKVNSDDASANPMVLEASHPAPRMAIWQLEGAIERILPELFSSNYRESLVDEERFLAKDARARQASAGDEDPVPEESGF